MIRFTHSVFTKASPELAWEIFSDLRRWNQFANIYGELRWREGKPWEPGSRLQIEVLQPINTIVDHVITNCVPGRRVGWIDHALGAAMGQWVTFESAGDKGTRVHTWGDIVHKNLQLNGQTLEEIIRNVTVVWYDNFRLACDRTAMEQMRSLNDVTSAQDNSAAGSSLPQ